MRYPLLALNSESLRVEKLGAPSGCPLGTTFLFLSQEWERTNPAIFLQTRNFLQHRLRANQIVLRIHADRIPRRRRHVNVDAVIEQP